MIRAARLLDDLRSLARIGVAPSGGITRRAFSPEYQEAASWLMDQMASAGLRTRTDAVGNIIGRLGPPGGPVVLSGSHLDTVPDGGWLDGAYGVVGALECARALNEARIPLRYAFEVAAFVDEEGAYVSLLGSRAMAGTLTWPELASARDVNGETLKTAMDCCGLDLTRFEEARRALADIHAYVELHIEQGPVLEQHNVQIGIVEGIVGILVAEFEFTGTADHAGTTPMEIRRDALCAAAEFITAFYERMKSERNARSTFGIINVLPGASNVVPRVARVTLDLRSLDPSVIEERSRDGAAIAETVARGHGVNVAMRRMSDHAPVTMSHDVMATIEASCAQASASWLRMPSGAGHDAHSFVGRWPSGMIFVPSRKGASHRPDEQTDEKHLCSGVDVLLRTVCTLCT